VNSRCILIPSLLILLLSVPVTRPALAQSADDEVFLHFRHQGVVNTFISSIYYQDQFYLSVNELFPALGIDLDVDTGRMQLTGNFLGEGRYNIELDSRVRRARFDAIDIDLTADDYIISDLGYYLHPDVMLRLFDMEFIFDFGNLAVSLESPHTMPVVAQRERERRRERMMRTQRELRRDYYPLLYDRNQQVFNAGFLDYNLTANLSEPGNSYLYNTSIGTELFGGDLQGSIFGSVSETATSLRSSGLRWRYGILDNEWISSITAGQTTAMGLVPVAYTGLRLTNEPIEPRFLYGETAFTGAVDPNSEVELYRNNNLIDFVQADETGQYRFTVPITYGSSNYSIRVFSPTGEMTQRDARLQIPFNFVPPGEVNYIFDAGRLDNPIAGSTDRGFMSKLNVNAGITNRITATGGMEYFEDFHESLPTLRAGVSSRLFTNYLVSAEAASEAFYRASMGVIYPNNASIDLSYTHFNVQGGIYNPSRNSSAFRGNFFTPFEIGSLPLFLRWSFTNEQRTTGPVTRYRVDLNSRIGRANLRLGYRDTQLGTLGFRTTAVGRVNTSATYNISRSRDIPSVMRGMFMRGQLNYIPAQSRIEDAEFQVSRNITQRGRMQLALGRNFIGEFNLLRFSFTYDFNSIRSNTSIRSTRNTTTLTQSLRGSIGYDSGNNKTLFTNRQQVGRSGVAVRMFVDNNNSGTFDEGDELIPDNAVRIDRAGGIRFMRDGISYVSQLQPYRQYNLTINKASITNPLLVPQVENFSVITDPNQFKIIDVPFYMSGIVEGVITRTAEDGRQTGLGGLRLYLRQINVPEGREPYTEEIRTFSDGSFYAYEIPPGDYIIEPDPSQLRFLNAEPDIERLEFTVQALAEGDVVEGLAMNIKPEGIQPPPEDAPVIVASYMEGEGRIYTRDGFGTCSYSAYLGSYDDFTIAFRAADAIEAQSGLVVDIIYNSRLEIYSVRTSSLLSRSELEAFIRDAAQFDRLPVGITDRCDGDDPGTLVNRYHIHLGRFSTREEAGIFANRFLSLTDLRVRVQSPDADGAYPVLAGPFASRNAMTDALLSLILVDDPELALSLPDDVPEEDFTEYEYILSLGEFTDAESAMELITQLEEATNIRLTLVQIDENRYQVFTEETSTDLREISELSDRFMAITGVAPPVGRITPAEPDTTDGERPAMVAERTFTMLPPDPEIDDTLRIARDIFVFDTTRIEVIEILEEEELQEIVPPVIDPVAPGPVDPVIPGRSLLECEYPIQVGSYGGHTLAQSYSDSISERLGVEIKLFYNELTDMFALRTDPEETLSEAFSAMLRYREIDPLNQYAIIGQCAGDDQFRQHRELAYLIPLIRYTRHDRALEYADSVSDRFELPAVVRTDQSGIYHGVFAGPVTRYLEAVQLRDDIAGRDIVSEPRVVIDPESRNRFRAHYQIYFGMFDEDEAVRDAAARFEGATGRSVSIRIGRDEMRHLFDDTVYGAWSEFLQDLAQMASEAGLDVSEIVIFD
jgi:hypothetical protein